MRRLALLLLVVACGETKHEVFLQGQKIEGDAERGPCKLQYTADSPAAVINTEIIKSCLAETEKAIVLYEKAKSMGLDTPDFHKVYDRSLERRDRLQSMLKMVGSMEVEQDLEDAPFKTQR